MMDQTTSKDFFFMRLPAELRSSIYGYALSYESYLQREYDNRFLGNSKVAALLQTSKLVETEAAPVFYAVNKFRFHHGPPPGLSTNSHVDRRGIDLPKRYIPLLRHVCLLSAYDAEHYRLSDPDELPEMFAQLSLSGSSIRTLSLCVWADHIIHGADLLRSRSYGDWLAAAVGRFGYLQHFNLIYGPRKQQEPIHRIKIRELVPSSSGTQPPTVCTTIEGLLRCIREHDRPAVNWACFELRTCLKAVICQVDLRGGRIVMSKEF
ncbi:hypothetical protein MMC24_002824 [Lignoscripta atroalba]|nr:hypothetical protein [Lignoscripta atroalba]